MESKSKGKYNTKQSSEILDFMTSNEGSHFTAQDISDYLRGKGSKVGSATIYRHLDRLINEGLINKYVIDEKSPACFEYIGHKNCRKESCYHMKCEKCGQLFHLHCEDIENFCAHIKEENGFTLDPRRTVFYGLCNACAAEVNA